MKIPSRKRLSVSRAMVAWLTLCLAIVSVITYTVFAENDFDAPGITDSGALWVPSLTTPDPDLTYMYDAAGKYTGDIKHLLKDAPSGHIYQTRLRVYYKTQPSTVRIDTDLFPNMCFFNRNTPDTFVEIKIGDTVVYNQVGYSEEQRISARTEFWKFDGNTGNRTLRTPPTNNEYRNRESRVCADIGGEAYTTTIYRERCGSRGGDSTCNGADTDNDFSLGDYNESTETRYNPPISSGCGGGTCRFGDRTFETAYLPNTVGMRRETGSGMWYADITVTMTGHNVQNENNSNHIRFKITAPPTASSPAFAVGHRENDPFTGGITWAQKFGLGNKVSVGAAQPDRGVKLALPFGIPCDAPAGGIKYVGLYDADISTFRDTYMYVLERDPDTGSIRRMSGGEFGNYFNVTPQALRVRVDADSDQTAWFSLDVKKGMQYMVLVVNPGQQAGQLQEPGQNVFSVGLPTDSIYGILNCKYRLTPLLGNVDRTFEYTPNLAVSGSIENNTPGAVTGDREWRVTKITFNGRPTEHPATGQTGADPCGFMTSGNAGASPRPDCSAIYTATYPASTSWSGTYTDPTGSYPAGTSICFVTSLRQPRWDTAATEWAHSAMKCSTSVKHPSLAVSYGDVRTGGSFGACSITLAGSNRGLYHGIVGHNYSDGLQHSYVNGAALSTGTISSFASLSAGPGTGVQGYFGRGPATPISQFNGMFYGDVNSAGAPSPLRTHCLSPVFESGRYATVTSGTTTVQTATLSGTNLTLGDITLGPNQRRVIRVTGSGTVQLNGNISYTGSATNIYELPQFVLLVDSPNINVVVGDTVTRLDGIYAGQGSFYTCFSHAATTNGRFDKWATAAFCPGQLKVNGVVIMSDRLYPYRTGGHNSAADRAPAEVFNLRPDILLSDYADGGTTPSLSTSSQRELAPRY